MQHLIYDVAVSADGYIAGPGGDASRFPHEGPWVDAYLRRLQSYSAVIMGLRTYEFGYAFGMQAGENPYPHADCHVISNELVLPGNAVLVHPRSEARAVIERLKQISQGPIYLCGGGVLAGWALKAGLIDRIRLKRAPIFLGSGTALFNGLSHPIDAKLIDQRCYEEGVVYQEWSL